MNKEIRKEWMALKRAVRGTASHFVALIRELTKLPEDAHLLMVRELRQKALQDFSRAYAKKIRAALSHSVKLRNFTEWKKLESLGDFNKIYSALGKIAKGTPVDEAIAAAQSARGGSHSGSPKSRTKGANTAPFEDYTPGFDTWLSLDAEKRASTVAATVQLLKKELDKIPALPEKQQFLALEMAKELLQVLRGSH